MKATSLEAHAKSLEFQGNHENKIIKALEALKKPSTYTEIANILGWLNPNRVSRRIPNLIEQGKIKIKEVRKCSIAKTNCSAYELING